MEDQPKPAVIEGCCKNCVAWRLLAPTGPVEVGAKSRGVCFGVPPTPVALYGKNGRVTGQTVLRACPAEDDMCLLFQARPDLIAGGVTPH